MPEMDGVECARQIRSIAVNESAIIILTAYRWDDIYDEAVKAGVDSFISKPLFAAAVIEEFRSAYTRKNSADGMNPCVRMVELAIRTYMKYLKDDTED